jgi:hypothetical protein
MSEKSCICQDLERLALMLEARAEDHPAKIEVIAIAPHQRTARYSATQT